MRDQECPSCLGARLRIEALSVFLQTKTKVPTRVIEKRKQLKLSEDSKRLNISDFSALTIEEALTVVDSLVLGPEQKAIAEPILREIKARLGFLSSVGLQYLSLDRKTSTLSGGEAQRIRLATQVGSGIVGAAYVLDEPTIGLHPRDNARLLGTLIHLANIGNSVLVVEHDEEMIRAADHVIDVGPGPGVHGGTIVAQGSIKEIENSKASTTGAYLRGDQSVETPKPKDRRKLTKKNSIVVTGASEHNLKNLKASFPLGGLIVVTGVSGSGKSTLVNDILLARAREHLHGRTQKLRSQRAGRQKAGAHQKISGLDAIDRIVEVDQSPIGRTPRSEPSHLYRDVR